MAKGGTLHVTLVSATLLPSTTLGGSEADPADSYATLICGKQQFTTRTAKDQGTLPTWNETHAFELEDHHEVESEDLVIEIFAARHELNELLGVAKLPLCKIIPANEETSLHSLSRPHEGECGQVKVTMKWESRVATTTTQSAAMYGGYEQIKPTAPMYPPGTTQPSAPVYPYRTSEEPYYGQQRYGDTSTPADAAASALAGLALNKDKQHGNESSQTSDQVGAVFCNFVHQHAEHQASHPTYPPVPENRESNSNQQPEMGSYGNDSGSYPPYSTQTSSHYPPQGLPYLASPIGGVVTGVPYESPTSAYTHPPFEVSSKFKESESVDQQYGLPATAYPESYHHIPPSPTVYPPTSVESAEKNKEKATEVPFETSYYSPPPVSQSESYPPNFNAYASSTGGQPYPGFSQYGGAPLPGHSESNPLAAPSYPPSADFSNKAQSTTPQEPGTDAAHFGITICPGYPPESNVAYPPNSSFPSSGQYDHSTPPAGYPGQMSAEQGKDKMNGPSQGVKEGETQEKGYHGHQYGYAPEGYAQPFYPPPAYPQYGYAPQNLAQGYPPQGYPPQYAPQYIAPGYGGVYPQHGHAPSGFMPPPFGASHGHQLPYGVAGHHQQHGHYNHHGGHGGHGGHKFKGHKGGHGYGHHGYGGHKSGHGYGGHKVSHGHGGYGYGYAPHYGHHGGHHSHHKH